LAASGPGFVIGASVQEAGWPALRVPSLSAIQRGRVGHTLRSPPALLQPRGRAPAAGIALGAAARKARARNRLVLRSGFDGTRLPAQWYCGHTARLPWRVALGGMNPPPPPCGRWTCPGASRVSCGPRRTAPTISPEWPWGRGQGGRYSPSCFRFAAVDSVPAPPRLRCAGCWARRPALGRRDSGSRESRR